MAKFPGVFIVDQDPDARYQTEQLVPETGFVVSGQSGLGTEAVAQASDVQPDLILCALREPMSRVTRTIEALSHALPNAPVVVYAASNDLDLARKAMLAGARDFLASPFKIEELRKSLNAALEAEERRHLLENNATLLSSRGAIITVFGAKGGVGKTTLATNLGVALATVTDQSCVLVDADDSFGDAATAIGVEPEHTLFDAMRLLDEDGADLDNVLAFHTSGLAIAGAPDDPLEWHGVDAERFQAMLDRLARQFDVVLVDTSGTLGEVSQAALDASSAVLWITTPDYASIRDSLQAIDAARRLGIDGERIRLVLNEISPELEVRREAVEEALGLSTYWAIPHDRQLRRAGRLGEAIVESHPNSRAGQTIADLARVLSGVPLASKKPGLVGRLLARSNGGLAHTVGKEKEVTA